MNLKSKLDRLEKSLSTGKRISWLEFISEDFEEKHPEVSKAFSEWIEQRDKEFSNSKEESILPEIEPELKKEILDFLQNPPEEFQEETDSETLREINREKLKGAILNE